MSAADVHFDQETAGDYPSDLYQFDRISPRIDDVHNVTASDVETFTRDGYLAVGQVLGRGEVGHILDALSAVLADPGESVVQYEAWAPDAIASGADRMDLVRKFSSFTLQNARLEELARDERILRVVRLLCGSDDVAMIQDMALLKPPGGGREKPWHQDNAFFNYEPGTPIIGVWIALDPATPENGCMHVIPGSHIEGPAPHFRRRDWQLCDADVERDRDTTVPLPAGGAMFFHGLIKHGTPTNNTVDQRRRAVQLHYIPASTPYIRDERRLAIFGAEGKDVTC